ncbi:MAG: hypothetical protein DLM60_08205 [Pseudonocardiales bacterium]|nr:MAG: hypothetical protein DLM60_08205 [Pseudonocardiales bacterium]
MKRPHLGYSFTLTATVIPVLVAVIVLTAIGKEAKGIRFGSAPIPTRHDSLLARRPIALSNLNNRNATGDDRP